MNYNFLILLFFCFVGHGFGFNILVNNPQFGGSHSLFMNKLALILADQGHNIVMIQSLLDENPDAPISHKNIEIVKAEVSVSMMSAIKHNIGDVWTKKKDSTDFARTGRVFHAACVDLYNNKTLMTTLKSKNFDLGLTEWIDSCGYGFFKHLGIERYISASGPTLPAELMGTLGVPSAISFVPGILSGQAERSFWGRAKDIFGYLMVDWVVIPSLQDKPAEAYQVFGGSWSFRDLIANSSFIWVNTDEYVDFPRPISHKYVNIGGFGMKKALSKINALEPKYQQIFQKAKKGVVYMSFGSVAQSAWMPREMKNNILEAFNEFPDVQFIWKYENETENIAAKYSNVHTGKWLPQREIISHEKALVFITHGGMNSITEATYAGIPMICIPLFGDQNRNAGMIKSKGSALILERDDLLKKDSIVKTLREFMEDKSYKQKAQELSKIIKNKPYSPEERIIKTAEFAAQYDVHEHLELAGRHMNIIQYYNIDVFFVALVLLNILIVVLLFVGLFVKNLIFGPSKREKTE